MSILLSCVTRIALADPIVTVESDDPNTLVNEVTGESSAVAVGAGGTASAYGTSWTTVCRVPCGISMSERYHFVSGPGITPSRRFLLPRDGEVTLKVKTGNEIIYYAGAAGVLPIGIGLFGAGLVAEICAAAGLGDTPSAKPLMLVGAPITVAGIAMLLLGRTKVEVTRKSAANGAVTLDLARAAVTF